MYGKSIKELDEQCRLRNWSIRTRTVFGKCKGYRYRVTQHNGFTKNNYPVGVIICHTL